MFYVLNRVSIPVYSVRQKAKIGGKLTEELSPKIGVRVTFKVNLYIKLFINICQVANIIKIFLLILAKKSPFLLWFLKLLIHRFIIHKNIDIVKLYVKLINKKVCR